MVYTGLYEYILVYHSIYYRMDHTFHASVQDLIFRI